VLFRWHRMLTTGRRDLKDVGAIGPYRAHGGIRCHPRSQGSFRGAAIGVSAG
jgi:hypothetical protein